jgi:hypothetical protein
MLSSFVKLKAHFVPCFDKRHYTAARGYGASCNGEKDKNFFIFLAFFVKFMHPGKTTKKNPKKQSKKFDSLIIVF